MNRQTALDATCEKGSYELMDINNMEFEYFTQVLDENQKEAEVETLKTDNPLIGLIELQEER